MPGIGTKKSAKSVEMEQFRCDVMEWKKKGLSLTKIVGQLGMPQTHASLKRVEAAVRVVRKEWAQARVRDYDALVDEQRARLEQALAELWAAWERSKTEYKGYYKWEKKWIHKRAKAKAQGDTFQPDLPRPKEITRKEQRESRDGNPAYMYQILSVINAISELEGLTDKKAKETQGPPIVGFQIFAPDDPVPQAPSSKNGEVTSQAS